jgi:hypothetical protein
MRAAYRSGDPYLEFAKQAGAVPPEATKETHEPIRDQFKQCVLAVQYPMGAESLASRLNQPVARARQIGISPFDLCGFLEVVRSRRKSCTAWRQATDRVWLATAPWA